MSTQLNDNSGAIHHEPMIENKVGEGQGVAMSTTWETIEERERRVRGTRTTSTMVRAWEQVPAGDTLKAAFAARPFINREDLRSIARQAYDRPVITLYLNFSAGRLGRSDRPLFLSIFSSLRPQALEAKKTYIDCLPHAHRHGGPHALRDGQDSVGRD